MRKSAQLPRTSRVNEKIREYYLKFGQDRDLEKYMRLYSPCGSRSDCKSRSSTTTDSSCRSEDEGRSIRRLFQQETDTTTESECEPKEFIVPIKMQSDNTIGKCLMSKADECTSSAPDLHTPPPSNIRKGQSKQTQTPDSIAKSHRRLEWDSLGDVGYRKSLSTSNISILERSVLKEYFQEISSISSTKKEVNTAVCTKTAKKLVDEQIQTTKKSEKTSKQHAPENNTPPLASSTMMQSNKEKQRSKSQPKLVSKSTSMSLQKRYDQYAQTSTYAPPQHTSREVQVTLSNTPSGTSSTGVGTATPSSFDYYSSRSARSTTDDENHAEKSALKSVHKNVIKSKINEETVHPFVTEINEILTACKSGHSSKHSNQHSSKQDSIVADLQKVHDTLKQAINENKENSSATSTIINSPQLDLGIQLLCSLIDARSLSQRQKKRLVRDIVKRISTLNPEDDNNVAHINNAITAQAEISGTQVNENKNGEATLETNSAVTVARTAKATMDMSELASNLPSSTSSEGVDEHVVRVDVLKKPSLPTTSAKARAQLANENTEHVRKLTITHARISAGTQVEALDVPQPKSSNMQGVAESIEFQKNSTTKEPVNLDKDTDKDSTASKASSTSKDVTTQKALINIESGDATDTDVDVVAHSTMREWLNPMTQSEIEYEQKKCEMVRIAAKKNKIAKCLESERIEPERQTQLQWIQTEIERLETLRCLLLKPNMEHVNALENNAATPINVEKLYDTVFTDTKLASVTSTTPTSTAHSSESDKPALQEIEVIIEESNEDEIKLDKQTKSTKQRKRETQIIYDKPTDQTNIYDNLVAGKARFRTMTETVTIKEEQVLPTTATLTADARAPPQQLPTAKERTQQRSKIDTPTGDSNDSESVGSFAQQRKREFLEQYRNKRRTHYESLLHQQQQMLIQQQQQIIQALQQRCNAITHSAAAAPTTAHYSVAHNLPNAYCACAAAQPHYHQAYFQQQQQHNNMCAQARTNIKRSQLAHPPCPPPCPPRVHSQQADAFNYSHKTQTIHSEQSTSSIFCISSEVSIPMGTSSTTSSTTTTTHQYDDVAAVSAAVPAVGVQTGDSLRRSQPIFGKRLQYNGVRVNAPHCYAYNPQTVCAGQSICVQVKPKAIAYVIQFEKKTTSSTTTTTTTTTTSASTAAASNESTPQPSSERNDLQRVPSEVCALQDYLVRAKPQFIAHTKERKAILNQIQMLREQRGRELRDIIENASENSLETHLQRLPPPATKRLRIFATKEMKAMTQRHCENLPEVLKQQERKREERRRQGNRLIRDLFNQRLQRRVRTGKLSLNHSKTVI